jgi:TfoX/Sxy family transcriptional regulator of competence genes
MGYDEKLAERVRQAIKSYKAIGEIKMFGGLCFTLHGNMCVGVLKDELMIRVPREEHDRVAKMPHVRPMDFTKRPMKGFFFVRPAGLKTPAAVKKWLTPSARYALTLPPKA